MPIFQNLAGEEHVVTYLPGHRSWVSRLCAGEGDRSGGLPLPHSVGEGVLYLVKEEEVLDHKGKKSEIVQSLVAVALTWLVSRIEDQSQSLSPSLSPSRRREERRGSPCWI